MQSVNLYKSGCVREGEKEELINAFGTAQHT